MKTLIVFYSLSGNTRKAAQILGSKLNADIEDINEKKDRTGKLHIFWGCVDALLNRKTEISEPKYDPLAYDLVIVGTPVWAGRMAPAVRTYLSRFSGKLKNVAFFSTRDSNETKPANIMHFNGMAKAAAIEPVSVLDVTKLDFDSGNFEEKFKKFADEINR